MSDMRRMQIGQIVDFCIEYNKRQEEGRKQAERKQEEESRPKKRQMTQAEINAFLG